MRLLAQLSLAAVASIGIALLLSIAMQLTHHDRLNATKLSLDERQFNQLTELNLVDFASSIPLQAQLVRIDWSEPIIAFDLRHADNKVARSELYEDYISLLTAAFVKTENVDRVLIRVVNMSDSKTGRTLYEWLEADRSRFSVTDYNRFLNRKMTAEEWIKGSFTLNGVHE